MVVGSVLFEDSNKISKMLFHYMRKIEFAFNSKLSTTNYKLPTLNFFLPKLKRINMNDLVILAEDFTIIFHEFLLALFIFQ